MMAVRLLDSRRSRRSGRPFTTSHREHGGGVYGDEGYVFQQLCLLPEFHDRNEGVMHPVIGLWMVRDEDVDLCVRESPNNVTNNISYFVPHAVRKGH